VRLGLTEKESISNFLVLRFLTIVVNLERANQLSLLPDKDLVNLYPLIESYQVTKSQFFRLYRTCHVKLSTTRACKACILRL
jgi:propanediol dehydratase small subunit